MIILTIIMICLGILIEIVGLYLNINFCFFAGILISTISTLGMALLASSRLIRYYKTYYAEEYHQMLDYKLKACTHQQFQKEVRQQLMKQWNFIPNEKDGILQKYQRNSKWMYIYIFPLGIYTPFGIAVIFIFLRTLTQ